MDQNERELLNEYHKRLVLVSETNSPSKKQYSVDHGMLSDSRMIPSAFSDARPLDILQQSTERSSQNRLLGQSLDNTYQESMAESQKVLNPYVQRYMQNKPPSEVPSKQVLNYDQKGMHHRIDVGGHSIQDDSSKKPNHHMTGSHRQLKPHVLAPEEILSELQSSIDPTMTIEEDTQNNIGNVIAQYRNPEAPPQRDSNFEVTMRSSTNQNNSYQPRSEIQQDKAQVQSPMAAQPSVGTDRYEFKSSFAKKYLEENDKRNPAETNRLSIGLSNNNMDTKVYESTAEIQNNIFQEVSKINREIDFKSKIESNLKMLEAKINRESCDNIIPQESEEDDGEDDGYSPLRNNYSKPMAPPLYQPNIGIQPSPIKVKDYIYQQKFLQESSQMRPTTLLDAIRSPEREYEEPHRALQVGQPDQYQNQPFRDPQKMLEPVLFDLYNRTTSESQISLAKSTQRTIPSPARDDRKPLISQNINIESSLLDIIEQNDYRMPREDSKKLIDTQEFNQRQYRNNEILQEMERRDSHHDQFKGISELREKHRDSIERIQRDSRPSTARDRSNRSRQQQERQIKNDDELQNCMLGNPFTQKREETVIEKEPDFSDFSPIKRQKPVEKPEMIMSPTESMKAELIKQQNEQQKRIDSMREINYEREKRIIQEEQDLQLVKQVSSASQSVSQKPPLSAKQTKPIQIYSRAPPKPSQAPVQKLFQHSSTFSQDNSKYLNAQPARKPVAPAKIEAERASSRRSQRGSKNDVQQNMKIKRLMKTVSSMLNDNTCIERKDAPIESRKQKRNMATSSSHQGQTKKLQNTDTTSRPGSAKKAPQKGKKISKTGLPTRQPSQQLLTQLKSKGAKPVVIPQQYPSSSVKSLQQKILQKRRNSTISNKSHESKRSGNVRGMIRAMDILNTDQDSKSNILSKRSNNTNNQKKTSETDGDSQYAGYKNYVQLHENRKDVEKDWGKQIYSGTNSLKKNDTNNQNDGQGLQTFKMDPSNNSISYSDLSFRQQMKHRFVKKQNYVSNKSQNSFTENSKRNEDFEQLSQLSHNSKSSLTLNRRQRRHFQAVTSMVENGDHMIKQNFETDFTAKQPKQSKKNNDKNPDMKKKTDNKKRQDIPPQKNYLKENKSRLVRMQFEKKKAEVIKMHKDIRQENTTQKKENISKPEWRSSPHFKKENKSDNDCASQKSYGARSRLSGYSEKSGRSNISRQRSKSRRRTSRERRPNSRSRISVERHDLKKQQQFNNNIMSKMDNLMDFLQSHCDACPQFKKEFDDLGI